MAGAGELFAVRLHQATPDQEQIQKIATAIDKPKPNALSVARAHSESRFARGRTSGNDMALLL